MEMNFICELPSTLCPGAPCPKLVVSGLIQLPAGCGLFVACARGLCLLRLVPKSLNLLHVHGNCLAPPPRQGMQPVDFPLLFPC